MKITQILLLGSAAAIHTEDEGVLSTGGMTSSNGKWIPDRYATEDDDQLMKNLIEQGLAYTKDKGFSQKYPF